MFTTLLILTGIYFLTRNKMIEPLTGIITSPFGFFPITNPSISNIINCEST